MLGYLNKPEVTGGGVPRSVVPHRRSRPPGRRRALLLPGSQQGRDPPAWPEHLGAGRSRSSSARTPASATSPPSLTPPRSEKTISASSSSPGRRSLRSTLHEVAAFCERRLPAFMVPRFYEEVAELPKTPSGRVEKYKLEGELSRAPSRPRLRPAPVALAAGSARRPSRAGDRCEPLRRRLEDPVLLAALGPLEPAVLHLDGAAGCRPQRRTPRSIRPRTPRCTCRSSGSPR